MSERFEEAVIAHCAPTLAGHKCGSLFSWRKTGGQDLAQELSSVNRLLQPKGVRVRLLKCCPAGALVYVYRPAMLHKRLERTDIADFLHGQGYASLKLSDALATLARHIHCGEEFPHEVGLFLSYPPEDVQGFIDHRAEDFKCAGLWKVYGDEQRAQLLFDRFRRCTQRYCALWQTGYRLEQLAVAV